MITEAELIELTHAKFEIWEKGDLVKFDQLFDNEGLLVCSGGKPETKSDILHLIQNRSKELKHHSIRKSIVRIFGETAVVHGEGEVDILENGSLQTKVMDFLDVWINRGESWKLVSVHLNL